MPKLTYSLTIGALPASSDLIEAIRRIEVETHIGLASMVRIRFATGLSSDGGSWSVLDDAGFDRLTKLSVKVQCGSGSSTLINAQVIEVRPMLTAKPRESYVDVIAMDATVSMNLEHKVRPWANMSDSSIASMIFAEHGLKPVVDTTQPVHQESDVVTMQRGGDAQFLRRLAARNGFEMYVAADPLLGIDEGHFHAPKVDGTPQGVLTVGAGSEANVDSFELRHDLLRPAKVSAPGLDWRTLQSQAASVDQTALTRLGASPESDRRSLRASGSGLSETGELQGFAQSLADRAAWAVSCEGEIAGVTYGDVIRPGLPINVRGAGTSFSGTYYVERVLHVISGDGYKQKFTLKRNALGVRLTDTFVETGAVSV
ncbi:MAG: contractile injection system protein, VgrG/Pvc8 family [Phycisphaerales bacterium]